MIKSLLLRSGIVLSSLTMSTASLVMLARPAIASAIETTDFTPQRFCTAETTAGLPVFSGTGAQLVSTVNSLPSNSTLVIGAGYYEVSLEMAVLGKTNVTICGAPNTRPHIKMLTNQWRIFSVTNSSNVRIEGLELSSINDVAHDQVSGLQAIEGAHHVYFWDNWVHDIPACGICSARSMGHNDFRYNRIWNTANYSRYQQSGISLFNNRNGGGANDQYGYSDYVIGNMVWNSRNLVGRGTDGNCIIIDYFKGVSKVPAYTGKTYIANNLCVANGGRGIHMLSSDNIDVVNNTLYHDLRAATKRGTGLDGHQGEISVYKSSNLRIINNLSIAIPYGNVYDTGSTGTNVILAGNMFNGPTSRHPSSGYTTIDDPLLVSPNENPVLPGIDFRPATSSPVNNAGVASFTGVLIPAVDFNGAPRNPAAPSVGAFEQ